MHHDLPDIERLCVYGVGGVGGYYGGRIAHIFNKAKHREREIYFIARGDHLKAIQQNGIVVKTSGKTIKGLPTRATSNINEIPKPDLILLCTKSYDLKAAVQAIKTQLKENTVIIPLLNGVDIYERIRTDLENGIVLPACVYLGTHIETAGVITQSGGEGIIVAGKDPRAPEYRADGVIRIFEELGIGFKWNDDPYPAIWEKFIFIAAFGLVTAFSSKTLGEVMDDEELRNAVRSIIQEIVAIAREKAVKLPEDISEKTMKKSANFPYDAKTSYQRDIESWPKPNEGDLYGGTILREGLACGIPTPVTERIYSRILSFQSET